jgi:phage-related protein
MTTQTFTWAPDAKPSGDVKFRVLTAQFGDGYKQAAADGINNREQSWPLSFTGTKAQITPIRDFLDARQGYQSFFWTPPLGVQGYYRCSEYAPRHLGGDAYQITCHL